AQLQARREDMRFKLEETRKKLEELDREKPSISNTANAALAKMQALRSQKTDSERLAKGLVVIDEKLAAARQQLRQAAGEEAIFLQEDIERLEKKRQQLLSELQSL
ncbi:MAG TPA: hypothetical protein VLB90_03160, partial [Pseudomonadales bacterium]|nr:hypothetical protein [Pseudomonadales bacterium]